MHHPDNASQWESSCSAVIDVTGPLAIPACVTVMDGNDWQYCECIVTKWNLQLPIAVTYLAHSVLHRQ